MTAEQLTLLTPSDLRALRIVCKACRGSITMQLDETIPRLDECPLCHANWRQPPAHRALTATEALAAALKAWLSADREASPGYSVQFEITPPHP